VVGFKNSGVDICRVVVYLEREREKLVCGKKGI
jgi:hypothetical protein